MNQQGEFEVAMPFMGFPGGKPKTIVVGLDEVLRDSKRIIQIRSSNEIYYDRIFVANGESIAMPNEPLAIQSAHLSYRGFSEEVSGGRPNPHWYDYTKQTSAPNWPPMEGLFTRYGDIQVLLESDDDRMVVMGAGDEMVIRFAMPKQEVPSGWRRDFILHSVGWDKDADLNTLEGQSSFPLPFAAMKSYPPPAQQSKEARKVMEINAPWLTRTQAYRTFWRH